ncbi:MAG: YtxH domain-containing protein [Bacteroidales bacterium]|nr:YtxH domain-containing protein [Candidatus Equimonas faecalis]
MRTFSILAAFIGGAALGAAAGILYAPESGKDTRKKLADQTHNLKQRMKEALEERGIQLNKKDLEDISEELRDEMI